jgi:TetR/AcrR family transcriptional regulator, transcriptional repressor for nem operon
MKARPERTEAAAAIAVADRHAWTSDSFVEVLRKRLRGIKDQRKGERTKARLRVAAVEALEARGYRDMRVVDICRRAKVTPAVLYLYYDDKPAIVLDVLTEFLNEFFATAKTPRADSLFEAIRLANLRWLRLARANARLMKCLLQISDDEPDFARLYGDANHQWYQRSVAVWQARFTETAFDQQAALLSAYVLGGMLDEIVRQLFMSPDQHLRQLCESLKLSDEDIAEYVTLVWYRALTASDPKRPASRAGKVFRPFVEAPARVAGARRTSTKPAKTDVDDAEAM